MRRGRVECRGRTRGGGWSLISGGEKGRRRGEGGVSLACHIF